MTAGVFPEWHNQPQSDGTFTRFVTSGLTKRELFAAYAMQGLLSAVYSSKEMLNEFTDVKHSPGNDLHARSYVSGCEAVSRNAVSYADALIAELSKEVRDGGAR